MFRPQDQQQDGVGPASQERTHGQAGSEEISPIIVNQPIFGSDGGTSTPDSMNPNYSPYPANVQTPMQPPFEVQYGAPPPMQDMHFSSIYPSQASFPLPHSIGPMNANMYGQYVPPFMAQGIPPPHVPHQQMSPYTIPPPHMHAGGGQRHPGARQRKFLSPQQSMARVPLASTDDGTVQTGIRALSLASTDQSIEEQDTGTGTSKKNILINAPSFLPSKPSFSPNNMPAGQNVQITSPRQTMTRPGMMSRTSMHRVEHPSNPTKSSTTMSYQPPEAPTVSLLSRLPSLPPAPQVHDANDVRQVALAFQQREDALMLRIEALGFQPELAWKVMNEIRTDQDPKSDITERENAAPVLGIRLLQRIDALQKENEELGDLLKEQIEKKATIKSELDDAKTLIGEMDLALSEAERNIEVVTAKAAAQERALAIACAKQSSAISGEKK